MTRTFRRALTAPDFCRSRSLDGGLGTISLPQVAPQVTTLLRALRGEMSRADLQSALALADRKSFRRRYLQPALAAGWIELTLPDKPSSRLQKYRLTERGAAAALNFSDNAGGKR